MKPNKINITFFYYHESKSHTISKSFDELSGIWWGWRRSVFQKHSSFSYSRQEHFDWWKLVFPCTAKARCSQVWPCSYLSLLSWPADAEQTCDSFFYPECNGSVLNRRVNIPPSAATCVFGHISWHSVMSRHNVTIVSVKVKTLASL